ncbi:MAG: hypothetical protein HY328_10835 [Chloroflexi bacterium]|nr:hypothetical protein [Chloroflexota bacterium]
MLQSNFIRWSGAALLVNGALFAIAQFVHPEDADPNALLHPLWSPLHFVVAVAFAIGAFGVVGLGRAQAGQAGRLGKVAVGVALFGAIISSIAAFVEVVLPSLVATHPGPKSMTAMLDPSGPVAWVLPIFLLTLVGFLFGYVLLGIAVMRAGVLPRLAGLVLTVSTIAHFAPIHLVKATSGVAFGLALMWLGFALWSRNSEAADRVAPVR